MMRTTGVLVSLYVLGALQPLSGARAETGGNPGKGLSYAAETCSNCHAILPSQTVSPVAAAPPFKAIADTRGMTETALAVWFRTPHQCMPNLIIKGEDMDDVIAYIVSLRTKR